MVYMYHEEIVPWSSQAEHRPPAYKQWELNWESEVGTTLMYCFDLITLKFVGTQSLTDTYCSSYDSLSICSEPQSEPGRVIRNSSVCSIDRQLDEVFGPSQGDSESDTTIVSECKENSPEDENALKSGLTLSQQTEQEVEQPHNDSIETSSESVPVIDVEKKDETEQDFISHVAQELTQEILKECQLSMSSMASQQSTVHSSITSLNKEKVKSLVDKSLQTSLEMLASGNDIDSPTQSTEADRRPKSAHISSTRVPLELTSRPHSARGPGNSSTIFVDMSNLQATELDDS